MDGLNIAALALIFSAVIIIVWGIVVVHTLPGKIAKKRHHSQTEAIEITAYLGLLVFPLWMAALIWAYLVPVRLNATLETDGDSHDDGHGTGKATQSVSMELGHHDMKEGEA